MPLPTVINDPLNTILGQKNYITFTPDGGTAVSFLSEKMTYSVSTETVRREKLDTDGLIRADRIVPTKQKETVKFEATDVKKFATLFGTSLGGFKQGTVEVWCVDPQDTSGKCSLHMASFKCLMTLDGDVGISSTEFSKGSITFEAKEKITMSTDFTIV